MHWQNNSIFTSKLFFIPVKVNNLLSLKTTYFLTINISDFAVYAMDSRSKPLKIILTLFWTT